MEEKKKIKVLVVPSDRSGVGLYRSTSPHTKLQELYGDDAYYAPSGGQGHEGPARGLQPLRRLRAFRPAQRQGAGGPQGRGVPAAAVGHARRLRGTGAQLRAADAFEAAGSAAEDLRLAAAAAQ